MLEKGNEEIDGLVFNHRNNPDLPAKKSAELTENGIGVVDWGTELSWEYDGISEDHQGAARRSFETMQNLNEYGGYGVMHTKGFDEVAIGRVDPPSIRFLRLKNVNGDVKYYKSFQFNTYSMVDDVSEDFPAVHKLISNRSHLETLQTVKEKEDTETSPHSVIDAYVELDLAGELEQVDYESDYGT